MGVISVDQLVTNLEIQRAKFTTSDCCVLDSEERRYERMVALMQDAADQRSRGSEWRRRKAVQTLLEIAAIGAEVFFLSTLVTKVSHLVILDERDIIGAFRTWWSCAPRASSLTEVARQLWETYSLDQIVPTRGRKRTLQEAQLEADPGKLQPPTYDGRQIQYTCAEAAIDRMPLVGESIFSAVRSSKQWTFERSAGGRPTTDCLMALVPENPSGDIAITLHVGYKAGLELIKALRMKEATSAAVVNE